MAIHMDPTKRHDFVLHLEVVNSNPNGDPDAGGRPRVDPRTNIGLISGESVKRKIRDYVQMSKAGENGYDIFIANNTYLNAKIEEGVVSVGLDPQKTKERSLEDIQNASGWMAQKYFDIRVFGGLLTTGANAGQVRGPLQIGMGRSFDPVVVQEVTITRSAVTTEAEFQERVGKGVVGTMGNKPVVLYGLYEIRGIYNPFFGQQTGVTEDDLQLVWESLVMAWDLTASSTRGQVTPRGLYIFSHDNQLGRCPSHQLFDAIQVTRTVDEEMLRSYDDYEVVVPDKTPDGVSMTTMC